MGHDLATLCVPLLFVCGCSLLYDPDHIKITDAMPDAMVDANPANLTITGVESPDLLEGQGDDGSRQAVLVVRGTSIINGATLTITPQSGTATIEVGDAVVSAQSDLIAVPVTAKVDGTLSGTQTVMFDVKVSQATDSGTVEQMTTWKLKGLDELTGNKSVDTTLDPPKLYSRVDVDTLSYTGNKAILVRAVAGIRIGTTTTGDLNLDATNTTTSVPGPGGGAGGAKESDGGGPGYGHRGSAGGLLGDTGGGGAGFVTMGTNGGNNASSGGAATGDVLITTYKGTSNYTASASSGGGGADGFGGAGGGMIELTAGGNLSCKAISAKGSPGKNSTTSGGGGGGSGGVVVLRSGATATFGTLTLTGGIGGTGGLLNGAADGGGGKEGRARVDAATLGGPAGSAHRGVMFDSATPVIVRSATPMLHLFGSTNDNFDIHRASTTYVSQDMRAISFGGATELDEPTPPLTPGFNRICIVPKDSGLGNPESRNCIDIAYLP